MRLVIERLRFSEPIGTLLVVCDEEDTAQGTVRFVEFGDDDVRQLRLI